MYNNFISFFVNKNIGIYIFKFQKAIKQRINKKKNENKNNL